MINGYSLLSDSEIIPEEKFELNFVDLDPRLYIAPWRSLFIAKKLDQVKIPDECTHTILKWEWEIPEINNVILNSNIKSVFCTSTSRRWPIKSYLYPDFVKPEIKDEEPKSGIFFMGWANNELRKSILKNYGGRFGVTLRDSYYTYEPNRNKEMEKQYVTGLANCSFALCPKGVGSGTRRFWESLAAGAIPVLISDQLELPAIWDWDKTIVRVSEKRALYTPNVLHNVTVFKGIEEKREMCRAAHRFFSNADNIKEYIKNVARW